MESGVKAQGAKLLYFHSAQRVLSACKHCSAAPYQPNLKIRQLSCHEGAIHPHSGALSLVCLGAAAAGDITASLQGLVSLGPDQIGKTCFWVVLLKAP